MKIVVKDESKLKSDTRRVRVGRALQSINDQDSANRVQITDPRVSGQNASVQNCAHGNLAFVNSSETER
jgi:hypothetical protein